MITSKEEFEDLIELNGFTIKRVNNHIVYSDGTSNVVTAKTPSDHRALNNMVRDLKSACRRSGRDFKMFEQEVRIRKPKQEQKENQLFNPALPKEIIMEKKIMPLDDRAFEMAKAMTEQGMKQSDIADRLNAIGYTLTKPGTKVSQSELSRFLRGRGLQKNNQSVISKKKIAAGTVRMPKKTKKLSLLQKVEDIISSNLSNEMKEEFVMTCVSKHQVEE